MRSTTFGILAVLTAAASLAFGASNTTRLTPRGTGSMRTAVANGAETGYETRQGPEVDAHFSRKVNGTIAPARVPADHVPAPAGSPIGLAGAGFSGFGGISHRDQRLAGDGNQFSLEPPDQALAVGHGYAVSYTHLR